MSEQELKPCPFCGGKNIYTEGGETYRWVRKVCADCGASSGDVRVGQDLIESWNTRTETKALTADEIYEAIKYAELTDDDTACEIAQAIHAAQEAKKNE